MLLFWFTCILLQIAFAWYNWAFITGKQDFHISGAVVAVMVAVLAGVSSQFYFTWGCALSLPFIVLSCRWIVFDIALNIFMGKIWWYIGNITKGMRNQKPIYKNGAMDRSLKYWQFPLKAACLIISLILTINYL